MAFSKDQRTVFVSQLVMRTTERDLKKYFKRIVGCKVNDVILLRDRRNARNHKGCAYVEVGRIDDVARAVGVSGRPPDFQRFPILVKASEAEKNYTQHPSAASGGANHKEAAAPPGTAASTFLPPLRDETGRLIESQKVYVGGLDPSVGEDHLRALFSRFGTLHGVHLQTDPATRASKGYAFLSFRDPKVSHLAIRTMAGKLLAGRPLKTGWANQNQQSAASIAAGCTVATSDRYPEDAPALAKEALSVLAQMTGGGVVPAAAEAPAVLAPAADPSALSAVAAQELDKAMGLSAGAGTTAGMVAQPAGLSGMPTVAEARASLAADVVARQLAAATAAKSSFIRGRAAPTRHLMVHNMYDKDQETEAGWEKDIEEEFLGECSKFGTIERVTVLHDQPGGKIRATFADVGSARNCAENLAGRWFDQRQLTVDYLPGDGEEPEA